MTIRPPATEEELRMRAEWITGRTIGEIARLLGRSVPTPGVRGKGKVGDLIERALGAEAGSAAIPDFPRLGIELKTIPLGPKGVPRESTFVCSISLASADRAEWIGSVVHAKLSHVLFIPVLAHSSLDPNERTIGKPLFWRPTHEQEEILRNDFVDLMGLIGAGGIESVTARAGRYLQVRPKAATSRVRTISFGPEGEWISTVPRGFYLRAGFTGALLADPRAIPLVASSVQ